MSGFYREAREGEGGGFTGLRMDEMKFSHKRGIYDKERQNSRFFFMIWSLLSHISNQNISNC